MVDFYMIEELAEGSRTCNISISDGLVSGVMWIIKKFKWPALRRDQLKEGELPLAILIVFHDWKQDKRLLWYRSSYSKVSSRVYGNAYLRS